ncbi:MAG: type II secretion system minor pseudopilin GspK [Sulfuricaulis sp.]
MPKRPAILPRQRGLALITAMLVVAIAATTAAYLSLDQQIWLRQAQNLADRAQADAVRFAAEEWAITILDKADKNNTSDDDLTQNWAQPLPPIPVEGGQVTGQIFDAQARFNLNNLVQGDTPNAAEIGTFKNLLQSLSIDPNLSDAVVDWIDTDDNTLPYGAEDSYYLQLQPPYRTANQAMQSVDELRLVRGFTPDIVEKLRPYITVLPVMTSININTAPKPVLSALFFTLSSAAIDQIIALRPYTDPTQVALKVPELAAAVTKATFGSYGVKSSYFEVTVATQFDRYQRTTLSLVQRSPGSGSSVLWHRQLLPANIAAAVSKLSKNPDAAAGENIM